MRKLKLSAWSMVLVSAFLCGTSSAQNGSSAPAGTAANASPADWTTWGYDPERSGWNRGETTLNKDNVSKMKLRWSAQLSTPVTDIALSTVTAPLVVAGVNTAQGVKSLVFILGANDTLFALDADSGKIVWQKTYANTIAALRPGTWSCSNTANDTPVIDKAKGVIYFIPSDGKLYGVSLSDGSDRMTPTEFISPFSRAWSLNLIDDVIYTTNARSCGEVINLKSEIAAASSPTVQAPRAAPAGGAAGARGAPPAAAAAAGPTEPGAISAIDVSDPAHPKVTHYFPSGGRQAGPWGRGGVARTPKGVVTQTADGLYDPGLGSFGESVLEVSPKATRLVDSFTPANWTDMNTHDLDFGSGSPVTFTFQGKTLVAAAGKEGFVYLLDTADMGGANATVLAGREPNHFTPFYKSPQLGDDAKQGTDPGQGMWGAISTYLTPDGRRFLYLPMWGAPSKSAPAFKNSYGPAPTGSIMAFQVIADGNKVAMDPQWISVDLTVPDPPVVANGVVYAIQTGEQTIQNPGRMNPPVPGAPVGAAARDPAASAKYRATPVSNLVLYAMDAETGKVLYSSKKIIPNWTHFSEPVVALGKVFVVTHDAHVYAFGLN